MQDRRWAILAVLSVARITFGFQFQSVASVSPYLVETLAINYAETGFLFGLYMLPGVVFALPGGQLGDRLGDKRIALAGLALMVLGGLLIGVAESYAMALAGRLLSGIGAVLMNVLMTKMVADWFAGREIVTAMAVFINGWPIGIALGLLVFPLIAEDLSGAAVFHVTATVSAVALVLMAAFYRHPAALQAQLDAAAGSRLSREELVLVSMAGMMWAVFNGGYAAMLGFAPAYLVTIGMSAAGAGAVISLSTWIGVVSTLLAGVLADRVKRPSLFIAVGTMGWAAGMLLVPFWSATVVLFVLMGLFAGPGISSIASLPAQLLRPQSRAVGMGVYFTWLYGGLAVLPPLAGIAGDRFGDPAAPLLVAAALSASAMLPLVLLRVMQARAAG